MNPSQGASYAGIKAVSAIEEWWGDELSPALIKRIVEAPWDHLFEFYHSWPLAPSGNPELDDHPVPSIEPGTIRPMFPDYDDLRGLEMLLYAHSVLLSSHYLGVLQPLHLHDLLEDRESVRQGLDYFLQNLLTLKPFILGGLVHFGNLHALPYERNFYFEKGTFEEEMEDLRRSFRRKNIELSDSALAEMVRADELSAVEYAFQRRAGTPLVTNELDAKVVAGWRKNIAYEMDASTPRLTTLGQITLPRPSNTLRDILSLRLEQDIFTLWRNDFGEALQAINDVEISSNEVTDARKFFHAKLNEATVRLRKELERSRRGPTFKRVMGTFTVGTAASAAAAMTVPGLNFWENLQLSGLTGLGTAAWTYRAEQKKDARLVDRLVASFLPTE